MSEYAELNVPDVWQGWRNPVKYTTLEELGIVLDGLVFRPMPPAEKASGDAVKRSMPELSDRQTMKHAFLTIAQAKKALAATYEVEEEAIEITIRG